MLETPPLYAYYRYRKIIWETGFSMCALPVERNRGNQAPSQAVRVATASSCSGCGSLSFVPRLLERLFTTWLSALKPYISEITPTSLNSAHSLRSPGDSLSDYY